MVKWVKLFGNQYLGFWILGVALFVIQETPYMIMPFLKLESNPIMSMQESSIILDVCEKILGSMCIAMMTFIVHKDSVCFSIANSREQIFFSLTVIVLLLNFIGWAFYFAGHQSVFVMLFFIVLLPPLYYVFIGLWRNNTILIITGSLFLIIHFIHVLDNLRIGS